MYVSATEDYDEPLHLTHTHTQTHTHTHTHTHTVIPVGCMVMGGRRQTVAERQIRRCCTETDS